MKSKSKVKTSKRCRRSALKEILSYDTYDTSAMIDAKAPLKFENIGLKIPETSTTQVISLRLPAQLINQIRALGSSRDIPYQALIKLFLAEGGVEVARPSWTQQLIFNSWSGASF